VEASEGFDESAAVMAHGLLASVGIITTAADTLRRHYERLDQDRREALFDMIMMQGSHLEGVLKDMVRGLSPDVIEALSALRRNDTSNLRA